MRKFEQSYVLSAIVERRIEKYFHVVSFNVDFGILAIHVKPTAILNAFPWNQSSADMRTIAEWLCELDLRLRDSECPTTKWWDIPLSLGETK